jgi:hypothetical protein
VGRGGSEVGAAWWDTVGEDRTIVFLLYFSSLEPENLSFDARRVQEVPWKIPLHRLFLGFQVGSLVCLPDRQWKSRFFDLLHDR